MADEKKEVSTSKVIRYGQAGQKIEHGGAEPTKHAEGKGERSVFTRRDEKGALTTFGK